MLEWKVIEGGNKVEVTTAFGKVIIKREKWIDYYREKLMKYPKSSVGDKEILIVPAEEEKRIISLFSSY